MRGIGRVNPLQLPVKLARDEEAVKGQLQLQDVLLEGVRVRDLQDALPTANEEPGQRYQWHHRRTDQHIQPRQVRKTLGRLYGARIALLREEQLQNYSYNKPEPRQNCIQAGQGA